MPAFLYHSIIFPCVVLKSTASQPYDVLSIAFSNALFSFSQVCDVAVKAWRLIDFKLPFLATEFRSGNVLAFD